MKKNYFNRIKKFKTIYFFFFFLFANFFPSFGQVQQNDVLFVDDNTVMYLDVNVGDYSFGVSPALSSSTRTNLNYGRLAFDEGVTYSNVSNMHFFDGYVTTYSTNDFIFPIGQSGLFAPAKINATGVDGVDAAYYAADPSVVLGASFTGDINAIYTSGYWNIQRTSASTANGIVSLSWSSSLSSLIGTDLNALTIVGWNGTTSSWEEIISTVDGTSFLGSSSTVNSGSITTNSDVDLSSYKYFTLASRETCAPVIADNGITTTWDGTSWDMGVPTEQSIAVLNNDFSGSLIANSLDLGVYNVTLTDGEVLEVVKGITATTGKVIMSSGASLVQRDDSASAPQIELTKNTRNLARYNYTYFSSPVVENVFSQLANAYYLNPSDNNRLYNHYKWTAGDEILFDTPYLSAWTALNSGNFVTPGNGWISSIKSQAPFISDAFQGVISLKFSGTANNGIVTTNVSASNASDPDHGSHYNLLGNPYPSAINADKFIDLNTDIDGVVYLWEAKTQVSSSGTGYYDESDYITYTKTGYTAPTGYSDTFNGKIGSGQGFMVRAIQDGSVTFNNCMRLSSGTDNSSFYKSQNFVPLAGDAVNFDSFKLNFSNSEGLFSQILIAYNDNEQIEVNNDLYDRGYDAIRNSVKGLQLYSLLPDNRKLAINTRSVFNQNDIIPLGFNVTDLNSNCVISINDKQGIFQNGLTDVFIFDSIDNVYHNLNVSDFVFTPNSLSDFSRFKVVYNTQVLSTNDFNLNSVGVHLNDNVLFVKSKDSNIKAVQVFDITGRLVQDFSKIDKLNFESDFYHAEGIYIVKVHTVDRAISTVKIINKI